MCEIKTLKLYFLKQNALFILLSIQLRYEDPHSLPVADSKLTFHRQKYHLIIQVNQLIRIYINSNEMKI
jgi:hypothetical protein